MTKTQIVRRLVLPVFLLLIGPTVRAQQPFVTDDADTTPKGKFHFEFSNQFDLLQKSAFPFLKQNTADFEIDYGLLENVEIGLAAPLITIFECYRDRSEDRDGNWGHEPVGQI